MTEHAPSPTTSARLPQLAREVAERILGFEDPVTVYRWNDRRKQECPLRRYRKVANSPLFSTEDYAAFSFPDGTEVSRALHVPPSFEDLRDAFALVEIMQEHGYEFALRRIGLKWGAVFHATVGEIVPRFLDSDTPNEAILRAALRTVGA